MGFGPISTYPISDMRVGAFFIQIQLQMELNTGLKSVLSEIQAETWKRIILAVEITALEL